MTHDGIPDPVRPGDRRRHVGDRLPGARNVIFGGKWQEIFALFGPALAQARHMSM
jgi:hypothetical protein